MASYNLDSVVQVTFLGGNNVGKSHIVSNYVNEGDVPEVIHETIGTEITSKNITLDYREIKLLIFDTPEPERCLQLSLVYARIAKAVICVYDITNRKSYDKIPYLVEKAKERADPRAIYFLVGNKADLVHDREVEKDEGEKFAVEHGMTFMECSGKTGLNISELFESIARQVVSVYEETHTTYDESFDVIELNDIIIDDNFTPKKKKKKKKREWKWLF